MTGTMTSLCPVLRSSSAWELFGRHTLRIVLQIKAMKILDDLILFGDFRGDRLTGIDILDQPVNSDKIAAKREKVPGEFLDEHARVGDIARKTFISLMVEPLLRACQKVACIPLRSQPIVKLDASRLTTAYLWPTCGLSPSAAALHQFGGAAGAGTPLPSHSAIR